MNPEEVAMRRKLRHLLRFAVLLLAAAAPLACGTSYVRLRGTSEIHRTSCPRVRRAHPDGIVPASLSDGAPCLECLREEAVEWAEDQ